MKTVFRFFLAACLILVLSSSALAQGPLFNVGDSVSLSYGAMMKSQFDLYSPMDHLFSIEEQSPEFKVKGLIGYDGPDMTVLEAEYTLNDFVYGALFYLDELELTNIRGGYLWEDLGVFASLDYLRMFEDSGYIVSGGYRFDLGGGSYAALSLDYYGGDYDGWFDGQAVVKYYADGLKLSGQLIVDEDGYYVVHGKANVAAGENLVWGGGLTWYDGGYYDVFAGLTWTGEKSLFDAVVKVDDDGDSIYYLSYLYSISDTVAVGLSYMDEDFTFDGLIGLKGKCKLGEGALTFSYTTMADSWEGAIIGLGYEKSL